MTEQYAAETITATNEQMTELSQLVNTMLDQRHKLDQLEESVKAAKSKLAYYEESVIPSFLTDLGFMELKTVQGLTVSIKEELYASIPKKNKAAAAQWLTDNGQGSLVKEQLTVALGSDADIAHVQALTEALEQAGFPTYAISKDINTASVKAVLKELIQQGKDVPLKLFGAYELRKAVVK